MLVKTKFELQNLRPMPQAGLAGKNGHWQGLNKCTKLSSLEGIMGREGIMNSAQ